VLEITAIAIIAVLILATIGLAAFVLAPKIAAGQIVYDERPDEPCNFGYGMGWLAIRTRDTSGVIERLGLSNVIPANWDNGLGTVYSEEVGADQLFVSPPVNGWTFVVGLALPQPMGKGFADKTIPLLLDLGVQYYLAYPEFDYFAWARIIDGKLVRAYAITDEGVTWNKGKQGREEKTLGIKHYEVRGVRRRKGNAAGDLVLYPTEGHVLNIASKWSLDPSRLEGLPASQTQGAIGMAPRHWKPERLRRSA
jgi:hypothetical protein